MRSLRMAAGLLVASITVTVPVMTAPPAAAAPVVDPPSAAVGHATGPQVSWLDRVAGCNRYVNPTATGASDGNDGTASKPWRTIQGAMTGLQPGQTGCVAAGTYAEQDLQPATPGSATLPIALKAQGAVTITAPGGAATFDFQTSSRTLQYWLLEGFTIDKRKQDGPAVQLLGIRPGQVRAIAIRNNVIRDGKTGSAVLVRGRTTDVLIEGNEITGFQRWESKDRARVAYDESPELERWDANAISIEAAPRYETGQPSVERIRIRRNSLHDNGGDGVQCQGAEGYGLPGELEFDPADIDIVDNRVVNTTGSTPVEENAYDIKSCQRVSIRGSDPPGAGTGGAQFNKIAELLPTRAADDRSDPDSGRPTNTSNGDAIVIHFSARSVLVENLRIWNVCTGINIGRDDARARDIVIRRTLLFGTRFGQAPPGGSTEDAKRCQGQGVSATDVARVDVYHNTITDVVTRGVILVSASSARPPTDVDIWNNIIVLRTPRTGEVPAGTSVPPGHWIYIGPGSDYTTIGSDYNLFWHPDADPAGRHFLRGHFNSSGQPVFEGVDLPTWYARTGYDQDRPAPLGSSRANPAFVPNPSTGDYFTPPGSPARDAALANVAGAPACGARPDVGFLESCS